MKQTVLEEIKKLEPSIGDLGFKNIWILPVKKQPVEEPSVRPLVIPITPVEWNKEIPSVVKADSLYKLIEDKLEIPVAPREPHVSLQIGVYHGRWEALRAQRRISNKLNLPVEIVQQWGYYKVIVKGFFTREETYKYYPEIAGSGLSKYYPDRRKIIFYMSIGNHA